MAPIRVLELRSVRGTGGGPEKTIMLGAAQADPREFAVTVCYIRDQRDAALPSPTGTENLRSDHGVTRIETQRTPAGASTNAGQQLRAAKPDSVPSQTGGVVGTPKTLT